MKRMNGSQVYLLALLVIGAAGMISSGALPVRTGFAIITAVCGYVYLSMERSRLEKQLRQEQKLMKQSQDVQLLQIVNRIRHDIMNDIQVLFGYIQLKKFDNLSSQMENIRASFHRESLISRLGIPSLVAYLYAFRVHVNKMQLEVGLEQELSLQDLPIRDELIYILVHDTIELFLAYSDAGQEEAGVLSLEFDEGNDHLLLDFVYQGSYDQEGLQHAVRERFFRDSGDFQVETHDFQEKEAALALRLPFRT
ncbi:Spo0B domain-containing protein [Paenibacillus sp. GP183]|uniref:Spo0B domain-containing protein n=1 Tax=Paenibacillus sp. GP183 TaxID=1882751 RepID=UPI00089A0B11|nr:Spo0B domain-containing protein [Paenibacillus sp. GP183]SEC72653.1 Sensor_kinase_SpoOB-type, alpha-helical domain [Paenibacillus sp. GP183]